MLIKPPDTIHTVRLLLRKPRREDARVMFAAYAQDTTVTRYLTWRPHTDISEAHAVVDGFLARWLEQTEFCWFLLARDTQEMVGSISARGEHHGFNLGFVLTQSRWSDSLMPEAITAVAEWAFSEPWVSRSGLFVTSRTTRLHVRWEKLDSKERAF
jgi:[ribosomal protein S5]-alanine N-acetyltransferase